MKICPNRDCPFLRNYGEASEYRDEIVHCVDCGTLLVDSTLAPSISSGLPTVANDAEEGALDLGELVVIATFDHPWHAHVHRAHLEAEGIPAFLFDEHMMTNNWLMANALGGVRLAVPESLREEALVILTNVDLATEADGDE